MRRLFLKAAGNFTFGYFLVAFLTFSSRLFSMPRRLELDDLLLPNLGMALYMALVTAIPAGIGFGLVMGFCRTLRELTPRRFAIVSVLAGAVAFPSTCGGIFVTHLFYDYGNRFGTLGGIFSLLAPGILLGVLLVGISRMTRSKDDSRDYRQS